MSTLALYPPRQTTAQAVTAIIPNSKIHLRPTCGAVAVAKEASLPAAFRQQRSKKQLTHRHHNNNNILLWDGGEYHYYPPTWDSGERIPSPIAWVLGRCPFGIVIPSMLGRRLQLGQNSTHLWIILMSHVLEEWPPFGSSQRHLCFVLCVQKFLIILLVFEFFDEIPNIFFLGQILSKNFNELDKMPQSYNNISFSLLRKFEIHK